VTFRGYDLTGGEKTIASFSVVPVVFQAPARTPTSPWREFFEHLPHAIFQGLVHLGRLF
jgi:hypothetical protein